MWGVAEARLSYRRPTCSSVTPITGLRFLSSGDEKSPGRHERPGLSRYDATDPLWSKDRLRNAPYHTLAGEGQRRPPRRSNSYPRFLSRVLRPSKKVLQRHVERQRKLIERANRYAIDGPFVFLQLLERNAERVGKHGLGQARLQPPQAQPRSNVAINGVRKTV